jgi:hypothetical protein
MASPFQFRVIAGARPEIQLVAPPQIGEEFECERARQAELLDAAEDRFNGQVVLALPWDEVGPLKCFEADYAWWMAITAGAASSEIAGWHLGVFVLAQRTDGQWVWQVRSDRVSYPGHLTAAASGSLDPGESFETMALTELAEEIGVMPCHCVRVGDEEAEAVQTLGVVLVTDGHASWLEVIMQVVIEADAPIGPSEEVHELRLGPLTDHDDLLMAPFVATAWSLITGTYLASD